MKVKCPYWRCCQIIKRRDEIDTHYQTCWACDCRDNHHLIGQCGLQIIDCHNNKHGCKVRMKRKELIQCHLQQCPFNRSSHDNHKQSIQLTQEQIDRIKRNKELALQRRRNRLSQLSQTDKNKTMMITEDMKRQIQEKKQKAIERRRMHRMRSSQMF